jgi:hypothetical protein
VSFQRRDAAASGDASQRALGHQRSQALKSVEVSEVQEKVLSSPRRNIEHTQDRGRESRLGQSVKGPGKRDVGHDIR